MKTLKIETGLVRIFTKNGNKVSSGHPLTVEAAQKIVSRNKQEWQGCEQVILKKDVPLEEAAKHFDKQG